MRVVSIAIVALSGIAAAPSRPPLGEMRWIAAGADVTEALSRQPPECLGPPVAPDTLYSVEIGRAAFRTPMLLGGQAARVGLSCASCHRNGRTNPVFAFPGLSGPPGTSDVTSALFSTRRDDGIDDPVPIPDLGGEKHRLKVDQDPAKPALRSFVHGLIVDEFDGTEPPPAVLAGVVAYVRAMDPQRCRGKTDVLVTADAAIADARRDVRAAIAALARNDRPAAALMIEAARWQLGLIDERYTLPALAGPRAQLRSAALDLTAALAAVRQGGRGAYDQLAAWLGRSPDWERSILQNKTGSLYGTAVLDGSSGRAVR